MHVSFNSFQLEINKKDLNIIVQKGICTIKRAHISSEHVSGIGRTSVLGLES